MKDVFRVGDIVYARFPTEEGGDLPHYCLVIKVEEKIVETELLIAYGSSKKVSREGHLPTEVVVLDKRYLLACGLKKPTRFDLAKRASVRARKTVRMGALPKECYGDLRKAAIAAALL
ncbi:MAG: hypothetical protein ACYDEV_04155 [Acidiferrobacter sp.]